VSSLWCI